LQIAFFELSIEVLLTCVVGATQFGGDGKELGAFALVVGVQLNVAMSVVAGSPIGLVKVRHHLIHSSTEGGGGNLPAGSTKAWPIDGNINRLSGS
jgi:hypothetical protein